MEGYMLTESKTKGTKDHNERLVFTHWDPAVYKPYHSINDFIIEIIWSALQYDRIYLRDMYLAFNAHLAELFLKEESKGILERLLETGFVRIHTMKPEWYPKKLKNSPLEKPITARAEYVEKYSTYGTEKFKPNETLKRFHEKLDRFLKNNYETAIEEQPDYSIPEVFRQEFLETVCTRENQNVLLEHGCYQGLSYRCLDEFAEYAANPEYAKSKIIESGQKVPPHPKGKLRYIRSLAYQCSALPKYNQFERKAIQKLIQSIFAKVYCDSMSSDGCYNNLLPETIIKMEDNKQDPILSLRVEIAKGVNIKIDRNAFLEALIKAREETLYLRNPIRSFQNITDVRNELKIAADIFGKYYHDNLPNSPIVVDDCKMLVGLLGANISFISLLPSPYKERAVATSIGVVSIAKLAECLKYVYRRKRSKQLSNNIKQAIDTRFVKPPLITKAKT